MEKATEIGNLTYFHVSEESKSSSPRTYLLVLALPIYQGAELIGYVYLFQNVVFLRRERHEMVSLQIPIWLIKEGRSISQVQ